MAIAHISSTTATHGAVTSHTISYPVGISSGEVLVLSYFSGQTTGNDITAFPTGFTTAFEYTQFGVRHFACSYRVADGTETGSVGFTSAGACRAVLILSRFSGVDNSTVLDVTLPTIAEGSSTSPEAPTLTTVTDGAAVLRLWWCRGGTGDQTLTTPATEITQDLSADPAATGVDVVGGLSWTTQGTAGSVGTATATQSVDTNWMSQTVALRPASAGGVVLPVFVHHYKQMGMI